MQNLPREQPVEGNSQPISSAIKLNYQTPKKNKPKQGDEALIVRLGEPPLSPRLPESIRRVRRIIYLIFFVAMLIGAGFAVRFVMGYGQLLDQVSHAR